MTRPVPLLRSDFSHIVALDTRWSDNDLYGHVNNVQYYSYMDSVVNRYLITVGGLDIHTGESIGLVVDSGCSYFAPVAFPDELEAGLRVLTLGKSSVRYQVAIFQKGGDVAVAQGHFVHVFVDRESRQSCPIPSRLRESLEKLAVLAE